ncbi:MAG TPA: hypothetical protein VH741_07905 [Candidatus Limnocylindrales bacterium]
MHTAFGEFLSYLDFLLWLNGDTNVDYIEVIILGANNDQSERLELTPDEVYWRNRFGLHSPGDKNIQSVVVHFKDGSTFDITQWVTEDVGETLEVRYPEEDEFGDCSEAPDDV